MEKQDIEIIEKHISTDDRLRMLVEEHRHFEKMLEKFSERTHLTTDEEMEEKRIKKLKLKGREEIERIISEYRRQKTRKKV